MLLNIKTFISFVNHFWLNLKLQTQIILATTILILALISSIASWPKTSVSNFINTNNSIENDLNVLLGDNISSLLLTDNRRELLPFLEKVYKRSNSLHYIAFIEEGGGQYTIPYGYNELVFNDLLPNLEKHPLRLKTPDTRNVTLQVTEIKNNGVFGILLIGTNSNLSLFNNNKILSKKINISIIGISTMLIILGATFVKLTIIQPLEEISQGLSNINTGSFSNRINLFFGIGTKNLTRNFNNFIERLEFYDEKNKEQLVRERIKLESLITTITDGIVLLDINLRIILVNTKAIKICSWKTKEKVLGTVIWDHFPKALQKKMFVILQNILLDSQSTILDGKIENQSIRLVLNIVYDSNDVNKLPVGISITIQDTTKEFELDKTQDRFISNISHELRTPLFNIKSFLETIQEYDYTLSNWQKRYFLNIVNKETNRLTRLVNDILCISKLDSLKKIRLETMNLIETINQATANYQIIACEKNLYLHYQITKSSLEVKGNKDLLLQVLINLIGNALKFTHKGGEIIIRAYLLTNKKIRIEILDTGIGIDELYWQNIFQRFYRVENEVHFLKGTGLGLSIVKNALAEHRTNINLVSKYNIGSVFWFDLTMVSNIK